MHGLAGFPFGLAAQCGVCSVAHPLALHGQRAGELINDTPLAGLKAAG